MAPGWLVVERNLPLPTPLSSCGLDQNIHSCSMRVLAEMRALATPCASRPLSGGLRQGPRSRSVRFVEESESAQPMANELRQRAFWAAARQCSCRQRPSQQVTAASSAASASTSSSAPPRRVVITGGSRGLGYAMAREFLQLGDAVALCGRNEERLAAAVHALRAEFGADRVHGMRCDCSSPQDMQQFAEFAWQQLGGVDIWLNNAGAPLCKRCSHCKEQSNNLHSSDGGS